MYRISILILSLTIVTPAVWAADTPKACYKTPADSLLGFQPHDPKTIEVAEVENEIKSVVAPASATSLVAEVQKEGPVVVGEVATAQSLPVSPSTKYLYDLYKSVNISSVATLDSQRALVNFNSLRLTPEMLRHLQVYTSHTGGTLNPALLQSQATPGTTFTGSGQTLTDQLRVNENNVAEAASFLPLSSREELYTASASLQQTQSSSTQVESTSPEPLVTEEGAVINDLADFISARGRAAAEDFVIKSVFNKLCTNADDSLKQMFPNTCKLRGTADDSNVLAIRNNYVALVTALRSDIAEVPACAFVLGQNMDLVYKLQYIYGEYANDNGSLEQLLFTLADTGLANTDSIDPTSHFCLYDSRTGFNSAAKCGAVVPILAYAAALRVDAYFTGDLVKSPEQWTAAQRLFIVHAYVAAFGELAKTNGLDPLRADVYARLGTIDDTVITKEAAVLYRYHQIRVTIGDRLKSIKAAKQDRDTIADEWRDINELTVTQLTELGEAALSPEQAKQLAGYVALIGDIQDMYSAMEARDYALALINAQPILSCFLDSADAARASYCPTGFGVQGALPGDLDTVLSVGGGLAAIADAKSSDQFSAALEDIASPIDAWKLRSQGNMLAVAAYPGFAYSRTSYEVHGYPSIPQDGGTLIAPLGLSATLGSCACGLVLNVFDLGNIIQQPSTVYFSGGKINGNVAATVSDIFSPGVLFVVRLGNSPFTFVAGAEYGPARYRTVDLNSNKTDYASRQTTILIGVSIDVVMFQF